MKSRPEWGQRRRGSLTLLRRARENERETDPAPPPAPPAPAAPEEHPARLRPAPGEFSDERRLRAAGGPEDHALYTCACGYTWETSVSASVACPNCGAAQAW